MHFMGQLAFAQSADFIYLFLPQKNKVVVFNQKRWLFSARVNAGIAPETSCAPRPTATALLPDWSFSDLQSH
jgi:hypothetical protein